MLHKSGHAYHPCYRNLMPTYFECELFPHKSQSPEDQPNPPLVHSPAHSCLQQAFLMSDSDDAEQSCKSDLLVEQP